MHTRPSGAFGSTPPRSPGSGTAVSAVRRLSIDTIGQPHTYANRPTARTYASGIRASGTAPTPSAAPADLLTGDSPSGGTPGAAGARPGGAPSGPEPPYLPPGPAHPLLIRPPAAAGGSWEPGAAPATDSGSGRRR